MLFDHFTVLCWHTKWTKAASDIILAATLACDKGKEDKHKHKDKHKDKGIAALHFTVLCCILRA